MEAHLAPLSNLRRLARALARGDAEAEDLLQDTALAAIEHPPPADRPLVPWFITVLRNRWRMDRRAEARRRAREEAATTERELADTSDAIDRARVLERLGRALVALEEPYRTTVIRRYLDGQSAARIARELGVPPATVRSRLKRGLEQLRADLDQTGPRARWQRALVPFAMVRAIGGATIVKSTTMKLGAVAVCLVLALLAVMWKLAPHGDASHAVAVAPAPVASPAASRPATPVVAAVAKPLPRHASLEAVPASPGGVLAGRVVNWSTGDGVAGAELTFAGGGSALVLHADAAGDFELAPPRPGAFSLVSITAAGFLPYAPEFEHSRVTAQLASGRAVRGMRLFLYPALDYFGRVVDASGAPVAGAHVQPRGTPEQAIYRLPAEWTSDRDGKFTFHAPDYAVLEATAGTRRGWGVVSGAVAISKHLVITIGDAQPRDATLTGRVVDEGGQPLPDVLVSAEPEAMHEGSTRVGGSTTTAADGTFLIDHLDRDAYAVRAEADGYATAQVDAKGGAHSLALTLVPGQTVEGAVTTTSGDPIPAYTLAVLRRNGAAREGVSTRSIADPSGSFEVHVLPGDYELVATAIGWAPSARVTASAGARGVRLQLTAGATVRGTVRSSLDGSPIAYARVMQESQLGGASAAPANTGTVTHTDGSFELTGVSPGSVQLSIAADGFHARIEGSLVAHDGDELGPLDVALTPLAPGETPGIEVVGIGVALAAEPAGLRIQRVIDGSGAQTAGIIVGDLITAVDGVATSDLGLDGAVKSIRGVAGTTVAITLQRAGGSVTLAVQRRALKA